MIKKKFNKIFLVLFVLAIVTSFFSVNQTNYKFIVSIFSHPIIILNIITIIITSILVIDKWQNQNKNNYLFLLTYFILNLISLTVSLSLIIQNYLNTIKYLIIPLMLIYEFYKHKNKINLIDMSITVFVWLFITLFIISLNGNYLFKQIGINSLSILQIINLFLNSISILFSLFLLEINKSKPEIQRNKLWFTLTFSSISLFIANILYSISFYTLPNLSDIYSSFFVLEYMSLIIGLMLIYYDDLNKIMCDSKIISNNDLSKNSNEYQNQSKNISGNESMQNNWNLENGKSYIIETKDPKYIYAIIQSEMQKRKILLFTRTNPNNIKETIAKKIKTYWLTEINGQNNATPNNLEEIQYTISHFLKENGKSSLVLIDGIEYLSTYNTFNHLSQLLQLIKDDTFKQKSVFLIPFNPLALSEQEVTMLEKEFNKLVIKEKQQ